VEHLSAETAVLKGTDSETHLNAVVRLIEPAVRKVELKHLRLIEEAILIHVMRLDVAGNMSEDHRAPFVAHLER